MLGFMIMAVVGVFFLAGGFAGLEALCISFWGMLSSFLLLPIVLFILMGDVMFVGGLGPPMMDALDNWLGRVPGRLSLEALGGGAIMSTLTGMDMAVVAVLGDVLVPEMEKRGYHRSMAMGPILGAGGFAVMIPPSDLAILLGALGKISMGQLLVAIVPAGVLLGILCATYIIIRCYLQPSIAPPFSTPPIPLSKKLKDTAHYILPVGLVIFSVIGLIILGIATPTEAGATGCVSVIILAVLIGKMNWQVLKKSVKSTLRTSGFILMAAAGGFAFAQLLAYTGAIEGLFEIAVGLDIAPIMMVIIMMVILTFLGMFIDPVSIMMITLPLFIPLIRLLGLDPVWFGVLFLLTLKTGGITPPYGICLFVMKGVGPTGTTIMDVIRAAIPFLIIDLIALAILMAFPQISLWLPSMMH